MKYICRYIIQRKQRAYKSDDINQHSQYNTFFAGVASLCVAVPLIIILAHYVINYLRLRSLNAGGDIDIFFDPLNALFGLDDSISAVATISVMATVVLLIACDIVHSVFNYFYCKIKRNWNNVVFKKLKIGDVCRILFLMLIFLFVAVQISNSLHVTNVPTMSILIAIAIVSVIVYYRKSKTPFALIACAVYLFTFLGVSFAFGAFYRFSPLGKTSSTDSQRIILTDQSRITGHIVMRTDSYIIFEHTGPLDSKKRVMIPTSSIKMIFFD